MTHKIFLSHNSKDKPLVEPIALRLADIFGTDRVFYDSWSIQPGESIIEKMSAGLNAPDFVFFFVSKNSLSSGMVQIEWHNALYSASKGKTRLIPVRIDDVEMPSVLQQTLFIDMYTHGMEPALANIVSVTQRTVSFTPQHLGFSNLSCRQNQQSDGFIEIEISASHLMEPCTTFAFITPNLMDDFRYSFNGGLPLNAYLKKDCLTHEMTGEKANALILNIIGHALGPKRPIRIKFEKTTNTPIHIWGVLHEKGEDRWEPIPPSAD